MAQLYWAPCQSVLAFVVAFQIMPFAPISTHRTHHEMAALELAAAFKRLSWIANLGGMFGASMIIHLLPDLAVAIGVHPHDHGKLLASWRGVIIGTICSCTVLLTGITGSVQLWHPRRWLRAGCW